ncbi:hypothetical protein AB6806_23875 [Bosea sp. RCC_152_1]|uniref:virion core protein, T7 gp14 family n=1 Tax=Bosea sp. RCC_152_1 TaxID=3239228 RepID=UPI003524092B
MCIAGAGAILSAGVGIFSAITGAAAANQQKWQNAAYQAQVNAQQEKYRAEMMVYNNDVYRSNIEYREKVLEYQKTEWDRQVAHVNDQSERTEQNYFVKMGALLTQAFEQQIAEMFQIEASNAEGRAARGSVNASIGERGIGDDSATAEALRGDLFRQEGEALQVIDKNRQSRDRQLVLNLDALKAEEYTKLASMQLTPDAPLAPLQVPSPVAPVAPVQQVSKGSNLSMYAQIGTAVLGGISGYAKANNLSF